MPPVLDMEWNPDSPTCKLRPAPPRRCAARCAPSWTSSSGTTARSRSSIPRSTSSTTTIWRRFTGYPYWLRSVAGHPTREYGSHPLTSGNIPGPASFPASRATPISMSSTAARPPGKSGWRKHALILGMRPRMLVRHCPLFAISFGPAQPKSPPLEMRRRERFLALIERMLDADRVAKALACAHPVRPARPARAGMRRRFRGMAARASRPKPVPPASATRALGACRGQHRSRRCWSAIAPRACSTRPSSHSPRRMISDYRLKQGAANLKKYADVFARAEQEFGVPGPVIAAFWALETDFGAVQGDFHTLNALVTLAHDCRRPELFRPQLVPLLTLIDRGVAAGRRQGRLGRRDRPDADPALRLSGARRRWRRRRQGRSARQRSDVIMTTANKILSRGWKRDQPWIEEVRVPTSCLGTRPAAPTSCRFTMDRMGCHQPRRLALDDNG